MVHKLIVYAWTGDEVESRMNRGQVNSEMISVKSFYFLAGSGPITYQRYGVELEVYTSISGDRGEREFVCSSGEKQGRGIKQACREAHQAVALA